VGCLAVSGDVDNRTQVSVVDRLYDLAADLGMASALQGYMPDGVWFEGAAYHDYGSSFLFYASAALRTATGSDAKLGDLT